jgi:hypothetical protein
MDQPIIDSRRIAAAPASAAVVTPASPAAASASAYPTATGAWGPKVSTDDYVEIQQLYAHFCRAWDVGDAEAMANCWTEDGEMTRGFGPGQSAADRKPGSGFKMGVGNGLTRHLNTNLVVTRTPEGARGSVYLLMYTLATNPASVGEVAIYDDMLVKTARGWKFKKRVVWRDDDDLSPFRPEQRKPSVADGNRKPT